MNYYKFGQAQLTSEVDLSWNIYANYIEVIKQDKVYIVTINFAEKRFTQRFNNLQTLKVKIVKFHFQDLASDEGEETPMEGYLLKRTSKGFKSWVR